MLGRLVSWFKRNDCTCDPYYGILGSPCPSHPVWQPHDLRDRMQRKCVEWGVYWRASDAHGIQVNVEQATELLADAVGVEVEITCQQEAPAHGQPVPEAARAHLKEAGIVMIEEPHKHPAADIYSLHGQGAQ